MLSLGIVGVLASVTIIALNPGKQLTDAENGKRKTLLRSQENALMQYIVGNSKLPVTTIPSSEAAAKPVCRGAVTAACVDLSAIAPTYIAAVPVDSKESDLSVTGYRVYLDKAQRPRICSDYLPAGDSNRCSASTYVAGGPSAPPLPAACGSPFAGGNGGYGSPYQICDCYGLQAMTGNNQYIINNDIDCSAVTYSGAGFTPIQNFSGGLEGEMHTVNGIRINRPGTANVGLFSSINSGVVRNLKLTNINYTAADHTGGIAGTVIDGQITGSSVTGTITTSGTAGFVGGLAGYVRSYQEQFGDWANVAINATVSIANNGGVGGLIGTLDNGSVSNSYAQGSVNAPNTHAGGLLGQALGFGWTYIQYCYSTGAVTGLMPQSSGFAYAGMEQGVYAYSNFYDTGTSGVGPGVGDQHLAVAKTTPEMKVKSTYEDAYWDFWGTWEINEGVSYPTLIPGGGGGVMP